eukprot:TRINITY_DN3845_c0_g1_i6.p1 TRINITY_DN3845_c0_g1~~TRINITY_DN3845_c0_g1_i6.p1  ORF type:complete len:403 (-),score=133.82 TRINITY_DN3845_c0_g1_i6:394-1602(-)
MAGVCLHSVQSNKCYEACADALFKMTGLNDGGTCPSFFSTTEKTSNVLTCSDGVTNVKYCTHPLYVVNVTMKTKGQAAVNMADAYWWTCVHREDSPNHKCYQACAADSSFAVGGLTYAGACPSTYPLVDSTRVIEACSDGITNLKYCTGGSLHAVNLTESVMGEEGVVMSLALTAPAPPTCIHREDAPNHKCYDACAADNDFKVSGLTYSGACPAGYPLVDSTTHVEACSDGVTNLKYCTGGSLHPVNLTERTMGEEGVVNKAYWEKVAGVGGDVTSLYKIAGDECGQATIDSKFSPLLQKAGLTVGTCASQGYTVTAGSRTMTLPLVGDVTLTEFKKSTVNVFDVNAECASDADCPSSYCQHGFCHGCFDKCCLTDTDCTKKGMTYCQNDSTKSPPYFCHA